MASSSTPAQRLFKVAVREREVWLSEGRYTVGRSELCSVPIEDARASRYHALLSVNEGTLTVEDVGSANGTFLNGTRVRSIPIALAPGDRVVIGSTEIVILMVLASDHFPPASRPTTVPPVHRSLTPQSQKLGTPPGHATERADALKLLGEVADRAMRAGHVEDAARMAGPELDRMVAEIRAGRSVQVVHLEWGLDQSLALAGATQAERWLELGLEIAAADPRLLESEQRVSALERAAAAVGPASARRLRRWEEAVRTALPSTAVSLLVRIGRIADLTARSDAGSTRGP